MNSISNLSVGHRLPNGWIVVAYAVCDQHGVIMARSVSAPKGVNIDSYVTWTITNDDLRSTANGHYFEGNQKVAFGDFRDRVSSMYLHS